MEVGDIMIIDPEVLTASYVYIPEYTPRATHTIIYNNEVRIYLGGRVPNLFQRLMLKLLFGFTVMRGYVC